MEKGFFLVDDSFLCFRHIYVQEGVFASVTKFLHHWTMISFIITEQGHNDGITHKLYDMSALIMTLALTL